jgi:hypothetical protein
MRAAGIATAHNARRIESIMVSESVPAIVIPRQSWARRNRPDLEAAYTAAAARAAIRAGFQPACRRLARSVRGTTPLACAALPIRRGAAHNDPLVPARAIVFVCRGRTCRVKETLR